MQAIRKYTATYENYDRTVTVYKLDDGRYRIVVTHDGVDTPGTYEATRIGLEYAIQWAKDQL